MNEPRETSYVLLRNFLPGDINKNFVEQVLQNKSYFFKRLSSPGYPAQDGYKGVSFDGLKLQIIERIRSFLPQLQKQFDLGTAIANNIESDISAYTNGHFLDVHNDIFCNESRTLSYIYYFHALPRKFNGGQLVIYKNKDSGDCYLVEPDNNTCVFFKSELYHKILPVACGDFGDGRFSVNGWIHF